ncbi:MAG: ribonuclease HI family protein [Candidatus Marinimicrobia bacterium]|nr:ribonuclease HI family protein [Candidatus Neomarinimicrobiota bacterium]
MQSDKINLLINDLSDSDRKIITNLKINISKESSNAVRLFVDGAADLNNKIAGIGGVAFQNDRKIFEFADFIGEATNNQAEYRSLIKGLELLIKNGIKSANIYMDSELVVRQINGRYKVKNERMIPLYNISCELLARMVQYSVTHIFRDKNQEADRLSKMGMRSK